MYVLFAAGDIFFGQGLKLFESEIDFDLRHFFQSLYEQSVHNLAYMWLESMPKLQIGQIRQNLTYLELEHELDLRLKKVL